MSPRALADEMDATSSRLVGLVNLLEEAGGLAVDDSGAIELAAGAGTPAELARDASEVAASHKRVEHSRLTMMRGYAETLGCRRQYLLAYFGEQLDQPCGSSDTCEAGTAHERPDDEDAPFPLQARVDHAQWGEGLVMRYEADRIVVLFEDVGYRTLSLPAVLSRELLRER